MEVDLASHERHGGQGLASAASPKHKIADNSAKSQPFPATTSEFQTARQSARRSAAKRARVAPGIDDPKFWRHLTSNFARDSNFGIEGVRDSCSSPEFQEYRRSSDWLVNKEQRHTDWLINDGAETC